MQCELRRGVREGKGREGRTLRPSNLVKAEQCTLLVERLADQVASLGRDVGVVFAEDLGWVKLIKIMVNP